jgi:hypothetical protein
LRVLVGGEKSEKAPILMIVARRLRVHGLAGRLRYGAIGRMVARLLARRWCRDDALSAVQGLMRGRLASAAHRETVVLGK